MRGAGLAGINVTQQQSVVLAPMLHIVTLMGALAPTKLLAKQPEVYGELILGMGALLGVRHLQNSALGILNQVLVQANQRKRACKYPYIYGKRNQSVVWQ